MQKKTPLMLIIIAVLLIIGCPALAQELGNTDIATQKTQTTPPHYDSTGTWTYTLIHEVTVTNNGLGVAFNVTVSVPLMDDAQLLYTTMHDERQSPIPATIREDADGHRIADYTLPYVYGNQSVTLIQRFAIEVSSGSYLVDRSNVGDYYSQDELTALSKYLQPSTEVQSHDYSIVDFTNTTISGITNPYQKARELFSAVNLMLSYNTAKDDQSAAATFDRGTAYCQGYTNLYIACLRAAGIPARQQSGYLYLAQQHTTAQYVDEVNQRLRLNSMRHTWVEFYLPGKGWVLADPTFTYTYESNGQVQKFIDWSYFANINLNRRYIAFREGPLAEGDVLHESIYYEATGGSIGAPVFKAYLVFGVHWQNFNDIGEHWAQEAITYCVQQELFNGISDYTFGPDRPMTRAMFISVIGRLYEVLGGQISEPAANLNFTDINPSDYYAKYLGWAVNNQIIEGYGNNRFGPDDNVNREQMAKIITIFAELMGQDTDIYLGALSTFADGENISVWARDAVSYCNGSGIITGMPGNTFEPSHIATRAQVAMIMQRLVSLIN